jgi:hypothetical protein
LPFAELEPGKSPCGGAGFPTAAPIAFLLHPVENVGFLAPERPLALRDA